MGEIHVRRIAQVMDTVWDLIHLHDEDADGLMDWDEIQNLFEDHEYAMALTRLGVDLTGLVEVIPFVLEQYGGHLTKPQFVKMVLDQRKNNPAKVKDHVETRTFLKLEMQRILKHNVSPPVLK